MHIIYIKNFFKQINMKKNYKKQILDPNIKIFSIIVRDNINIFSSTKILTQSEKNVVLQINSMSNAKKIWEELKWHIE